MAVSPGPASTVLRFLNGACGGDCLCGRLCEPCRKGDGSGYGEATVERVTPERVILTDGRVFRRPGGSSPRPGQRVIVDSRPGLIMRGQTHVPRPLAPDEPPFIPPRPRLEFMPPPLESRGWIAWAGSLQHYAQAWAYGPNIRPGPAYYDIENSGQYLHPTWQTEVGLMVAGALLPVRTLIEDGLGTEPQDARGLLYDRMVNWLEVAGDPARGGLVTYLGFLITAVTRSHTGVNVGTYTHVVSATVDVRAWRLVSRHVVPMPPHPLEPGAATVPMVYDPVRDSLNLSSAHNGWVRTDGWGGLGWFSARGRGQARVVALHAALYRQYDPDWKAMEYTGLRHFAYEYSVTVGGAPQVARRELPDGRVAWPYGYWGSWQRNVHYAGDGQLYHAGRDENGGLVLYVEVRPYATPEEPNIPSRRFGVGFGAPSSDGWPYDFKYTGSGMEKPGEGSGVFLHRGEATFPAFREGLYLQHDADGAPVRGSAGQGRRPVAEPDIPGQVTADLELKEDARYRVPLQIDVAPLWGDRLVVAGREYGVTRYSPLTRTAYLYLPAGRYPKGTPVLLKGRDDYPAPALYKAGNFRDPAIPQLGPTLRDTAYRREERYAASAEGLTPEQVRLVSKPYERDEQQVRRGGKVTLSGPRTVRLHFGRLDPGRVYAYIHCVTLGVLRGEGVTVSGRTLAPDRKVIAALTLGDWTPRTEPEDGRIELHIPEGATVQLYQVSVLLGVMP